jgi:hypothetical protein
MAKRNRDGYKFPCGHVTSAFRRTRPTNSRRSAESTLQKERLLDFTASAAAPWSAARDLPVPSREIQSPCLAPASLAAQRHAPALLRTANPAALSPCCESALAAASPQTIRPRPYFQDRKPRDVFPIAMPPSNSSAAQRVDSACVLHSPRRTPSPHHARAAKSPPKKTPRQCTFSHCCGSVWSVVFFVTLTLEGPPPLRPFQAQTRQLIARAQSLA